MKVKKLALNINAKNTLECVSSENETSLQGINPQSLPEKLAVYLPENLDLDKVIAKNPPEHFSAFQQKNIYFDKDKLVWIVNLITYLSTKKDYDYEENGGYVRLSKQKLQKLGIHDYRAHLDYLISCEIILENHQYFVGKKSGGIKFTPEYEFVKIHRIYIRKKTLIKAILSNSIEKNVLDMPEFHYLYKWWNTNKLHIDYLGAKYFLEKRLETDLSLFFDKHKVTEQAYFCAQLEKTERERKVGKVKYPTKQYNAAIAIIDKLHNHEYLMKVDPTAGRFHTLLTQLPKDLKQFITYNNKRLVGIDLRNSQPLLATALLDKEIFINNPILINTIIKCKLHYIRSSSYFSTMLANFIGRKQNNIDILEYRQLVSEGIYYERFGAILLEQGLIPDNITDVRKAAKTATFSSFFAPNQYSRVIEAMKHFKYYFPSVFEIFSKIKYTPKKTDKNEKLHKALSVCLQAFEADLFLRKICKRINDINPEILIFTIHDSIVTTLEYEEIVKEIIDEEVYKVIKIHPKFNIECWQYNN
jgi:hypothetical protein